MFRPEDWEADGAAPWPRAADVGERPEEARAEAPPAGEAVARARFDFYGLTIDVASRPAEPLSDLRRELASFERTDGVVRADALVDIRVEAPAWEDLPDLAEAAATSHSVSFHEGDKTWIDYLGRGLAVVDWRARRCAVQAAESGVARDIARAFVLAAAGRALDERGLHRVDALAVSHRDRGILLLLPAGAARDRLAAELLAQPGFRLLGEDTPLVDGRARILPFPLRLGATAELGDVAPAVFLIVGTRSLGAGSRIAGWSKPAALAALVKHMRLAGEPGARPELLPPASWRRPALDGRVVASRAASALRLLAAARPYRFLVGRDVRRSARALADLLA